MDVRQLAKRAALIAYCEIDSDPGMRARLRVIERVTADTLAGKDPFRNHPADLVADRERIYTELVSNLVASIHRRESAAEKN